MNKLILVMLMCLVCTSLVSGAQESLGTFRQDECITLIQTCASCTYVNFTSVLQPNSTQIESDIVGTQSGSEFTATFCNTTEIGNYIVNGIGDVDGTDTVFAYDFDITSTGKETPDSLPFILTGLFIIVFGISCFFLYLSSQTMEVGPKIFFFIASLVFLIGSVGIAAVVATDSNVSSAINNTMSAILLALGLIIFAIIAYVMIKQTVSILEIMNIKKGYSLGSSAQHGYQSYSNARGY